MSVGRAGRRGDRDVAERVVRGTRPRGPGSRRGPGRCGRCRAAPRRSGNCQVMFWVTSTDPSSLSDVLLVERRRQVVGRGRANAGPRRRSGPVAVGRVRGIRDQAGRATRTDRDRGARDAARVPASRRLTRGLGGTGRAGSRACPAARAGRAACRTPSCPWRWPISTLARPSLKYIDSGTTVWPLSRVLSGSGAARWRCSSSLRRRRGVWLVQVPWTYSGMCTPSSHSSSPSNVA